MPQMQQMPFNNAPVWNQPRMPQNLYVRPPNPPLPSNGPKPQPHQQPSPRIPSQPPPPKEQQAPPPPPPTEKAQPPPPPGIDSSKDSNPDKKTSDAPAPANLTKLNLSAPPPPPPPEDKTTKVAKAPQQINANQNIMNGARGGGVFRGRGGGNDANHSPFSKGRGFGSTASRGGFEGRNNAHLGFGAGQGANFFQEDNSEYDDGFESNFGEIGGQYKSQKSNAGGHLQESEQSKTPLRAGDWKCTKCEEINFSRRENCRRCNFQKNLSVLAKSNTIEDKATVLQGPATITGKSNTKLENFDKMFGNWEDSYAKWKSSNKENPDRNYVETYMAQMEAMRIQLLDKRKGLDNLNNEDNKANKKTAQLIPGINIEDERKQKMMENWQSQTGKVEKSFPYIEESSNEQKQDISAKELAQKILDDNSDDSDEETKKTETVKTKRSRWGNEEESQEPKRSRWENDPAVNINIQDWRRRPDVENSDKGPNFTERSSKMLANSEFDGRNEIHPTMQRQEFNNRNITNHNNQGQMFGNGRGQFENPPQAGQNNHQIYMRGNNTLNLRGRGGYNSHGEGNRFNETSEYENYWKPAAVTDYSANKTLPSSRRDVFVQRDFKPETFDYSHGTRQSPSTDYSHGSRQSPNTDYSHGTRQSPSTATNQRQLGKQSNSWNNGSRNSPRQNRMMGLNEKAERFQTPPPERSSPPAPVKPAGNRIMIDSIITPPGRSSRPPKIVIILRGLPGSGKSHLARLIKDKELEHGAEQPRTLALDDYFDVDGKYEFDPEMEDLYRSNFIKSFKKNVDGGYFHFLIVDAINSEVDHFRSMWSHAKQNGFEVYICDVECDVSAAAARNVHGRAEKEVQGLATAWEDTPPHMNTLDARGLLQDDAIEHFEMAEASDDVKEDTSEISQPVDEEVRSRKTSAGSIQCLSLHKNNNVSPRKILETLKSKTPRENQTEYFYRF